MTKVLDVRESHAQSILSNAQTLQNRGESSFCRTSFEVDLPRSLDSWHIQGRSLVNRKFKAVGTRRDQDVLPGRFFAELWLAYPGYSGGVLSERQKGQASKIIRCVLTQGLLHSGAVRFIHAPILSRLCSLSSALGVGDLEDPAGKELSRFYNFSLTTGEGCADNKGTEDASTATLVFLADFLYEYALPNHHNNKPLVASIDTTYGVRFALPSGPDSSSEGWVAEFTVLRSKLSYPDEYSELFEGDGQTQVQGKGVVFEFLRGIRERLFQSQDHPTDASVRDNFDDALMFISHTDQGIDLILSKQEYAKREMEQKARAERAEQKEGDATEALLSECVESTSSPRDDVNGVQETVRGERWLEGGLCGDPADASASTTTSGLSSKGIPEGTRAAQILSPAATSCPPTAAFFQPDVLQTPEHAIQAPEYEMVESGLALALVR